MTTQFLFGPAGWSYKDWEGTVYPDDKPGDFDQLRFIAQSFDFVEVNTTFYHIPSPKLTAGWAEKTSSLPNFKFWVKLYQQFTHLRKITTQDVTQFKAAIEPLKQSGKLEGLLVQFPYSFKLNTGYLKYFEGLTDVFKEYTLAAEFRHNSWERKEFLDILKKRNIIWVNIDQPVISQSLALTSYVTHPGICYFRLHGRNAKTWFSHDGRDARYDYSYNTLELNEIAQKIKELAALAKSIFISGNNHYKGSAIKNLGELKNILEKLSNPPA